MDPINYTAAFAGVPSPLQAFTQSFQTGAGIRQVTQQQDLQAQQLAQQEAMRKDLAALSANPSPQAVAQMSIRYPQLSEQFKRSYDMLNEDQKQNKLSAVIPVYAAIQNGRHDIAAEKLRETATAQENGGQKDEAARTRAMADLIEKHPETGAMTAGLLLSSVMGPEKFATTFGTLGTEGRAAAEAPAELLRKTAEARIKAAQAGAEPLKVSTDIANVQSQITERSKRLGLDQDKLTSDVQLKLAEMAQKNGELPEFVAKDVNAAATEAVAAQQSAARMTGLADQIDKAAGELSGGIEAKTGELWKKTFGTQNELTRIRAEYNRIVTPAAMAAYKQVASGSTSDKDIETALTGVPKDTDSPERMSQFLRGAAKLQVYDSVLNNAKTEWLGAVRNLGKAKADIEVDGVKVPAGTTFKAYADQIVGKKVADLIAAQAAQQIAARSYMRWATPAPATAAPVAAPELPAAGGN